MDATTLPTLLLGGDPDGRARRDLRRLVGAPSRCRRFAAWWSDGPCSTRPTTTSRTRSTPPCRWSGDGLMNVQYYLPAGTAGGEPTTRSRSRRSRPAGATPRCGSSPWTRPVSTSFDTGDDEVDRRAAERRRSPSRSTASHLDLDGREDVFAGPDRRRVRRHRTRSATLHSERGGRFALCGARTDTSPARCATAPRRGAGRAARRRSVQPPGPQLRHPGLADREQDHRLRGDHPRRQLVVLPGAQARRGDRDGVRAGGDLLLRDRSRAAGPARVRLHADLVISG